MQELGIDGSTKKVCLLTKHWITPTVCVAIEKIQGAGVRNVIVITTNSGKKIPNANIFIFLDETGKMTKCNPSM